MRKLLLTLLGIAIAVPAAIWIAGALAPERTVRAALALERALSGLSRHEVDVDGLRIAYLEGGQGEVLLLLHGFGADKDNWTRIARRLTPHYRVIAPDLPGFGESSSPPDARYRYQDQVPRIAAFLDALGIDRVHVGGSSMGGYFAAGLAARHPGRVASAWLLAPGGVAAAQPSEMMQRIAAGQGVVLLPKSRTEYDALIDFVMSDPPWLPGFYIEALSRRAAAREPLWRRIFDDIRLHSPPLEDEVRGLATPTLIHWGEQDRVLHVSGARVLADAMPNAEVVVLPGVGHLPMLEAERRVAKDYLRFRKRLEAAGGP